MAELGIKNRQQAPLRLLGRRGVGPARLRALRRHTLSDAELATICANLNFDMVGSPNYVRFVYDGDGSATPATAGPPGSAQIEDDLQPLLRQPGPGHRADGVRRPLRLRPVHRRRHPRRRPVHRRRGHQDRGAGGDLRRHRRRRLRPLLPPGLRHHQQPQHQGPVRDGRRRRPRDHDPGQDQDRVLRGRQLPVARTRVATAEFKDRKPPPDPPGPSGPADPEGREERGTCSSRPHRLGPTNSSSRATLPRLATDRLNGLFGRHSIPSWSQARPKIPRMSADTLLKW